MHAGCRAVHQSFLIITHSMGSRSPQACRLFRKQTPLTVCSGFEQRLDVDGLLKAFLSFAEGIYSLLAQPILQMQDFKGYSFPVVKISIKQLPFKLEDVTQLSHSSGHLMGGSKPVIKMICKTNLHAITTHRR